MTYLPPVNGGRINASIGGNSTNAGGGYTLISSGNMLLAGGNNITLSQNANSITFSAPNAPAAQTGISGLSAGTTMATSGTVSFSNASGVSFGLNGNTFTASVQTNYQSSNANYLTSQSNQAFSASGGSSAFQTLNFANSNGLTFSNTNGSVVASYTQSNQAFSASGGSSTFQTLSFANSNGLTFSNTNGSVVASYTVPTQSNQTLGFYATGNTTNNTTATYNAQSLTFNGGGAVSVGFSNGSIQIMDNGAGLGAIANSQTTYSSGTVNLIEGGGAITIASGANQSYKVSVPNTSSLSVTGMLSVSNNVSTISIGAPYFSAAVSNLGNTSGNTGTINSQTQFILAGGNNITLSQSTAAGAVTVSFSGIPAFSAGATNTGASGSTGTVSNQIVFVGGTNITLSQSTNAAGATLSILGVANNQAFSASGGSSAFQTLNFANSNGLTFSNTNGSVIASYTVPSQSNPAFSASGGSSSFQTLSFANSNGLTFSNTNGSVIASYTVPSQTNPTISFYQNRQPQNSVQPFATLGITYDTMVLQPLSPVEGYGFPGDMTISTFMMDMSGTQTATSVSSSFSSAVSLGIYLLNNSTQLTLVNSASSAWSAAANTGISTGMAGGRFLTIHSSQWSSAPVLSFNARYWFGVIHASTNLGTNAGAAWIGQYIGASTQRSGTWGVSEVINTSQGMVPFLGIYSTSLNSMPGSLGNNQINKVNISAGFAPAVILNATFSAF